MKIHPTAIIDPSAELASDVTVGPYACIGPNNVIGPGCVIDAHAVIHKNTHMGRDCRIHSFASIGGDPHAHSFQSSHETYLKVGDRVEIFEYVTAHRGTVDDHAETIISDDCYIMAYAHVAHDCFLDKGAKMVAHASLAGHVRLGKKAIIGAYAGITQFCHIGDYTMIVMYAHINHSVLPYLIASGRDHKTNKIEGLNVIGLQRAGFDADQIKRIKKIYLKVFRKGHSKEEAMGMLTENQDELNYRELLAQTERYVT